MSDSPPDSYWEPPDEDDETECQECGSPLGAQDGETICCDCEGELYPEAWEPDDYEDWKERTFYGR